MASFGNFFLFLLSSIISLFVLKASAAVALCGGSCGDQEIRFPFKLTGQPDRCGYPGFNLSCKNSETILSLPFSGDFSVQNIDYASQTIWLNDPDYCIPKRLLHSFTLNGSPYQELFPQNFTFLNCSTDDAAAVAGPVARPVDCLSGENYTVVSVPTNFYGGFETIQSCSEIATVVAPVTWPVWSDPSFGVALTWKEPDCRFCERNGGTCKYSSDSGIGVGCSGGFSHGMSKGVKYGLIFGLGAPLLFILVITLFLRERITGRNPPNGPNSGTISSSAIALGQSRVKGLDGQIIESYPITVLGESRRLPKPENNICAICLSDYEAKETLRTIPDCNHFFHASCLDEWLRLKGTCPMCRNTPDV